MGIIQPMKSRQSIALIGMAGVGKTSLGKYISIQKKLPFIDTDNLLEALIRMPLQTFIRKHGSLDLLKKEEAVVSTLTLQERTIIATGGSVIYSEKAMTHLKEIATIVWLQDSFENIQKRISNMENRGLINPERKSLEELFNERSVLYKKYADITVQYPSPFDTVEIKKKLLEVLR